MAATETLPLKTQEDVVIARQKVRAHATKLGFGVVNQTKIVTAASELARNTLIYGGGGSMTLGSVQKDGKSGLSIVFDDQGPGIPDIARAMTDGYTTGNGMGLGLSGTKRLVNEFSIESEVGKGTHIHIIQWK